jgi:glycosyltransferase involved in cell wall biosynthesis
MSLLFPPSAPIRIAYFSPLPPSRSGIADYSATLLSHLAREATITLFTGEPHSISDALQTNSPTRTIESYPESRWDFDLAIYQMGNSRHHDQIYETALRFPGLVVLHDHGLHHFIADRTAGQNDFSAYIREMGYELGVDGIELAWAIRDRQADHPIFEVPLNHRLIDRSLGLIVHSQTVANMLASHTTQPIKIIPALMEQQPGQSQRTALNLSPDTLIFASLGLVTPEKQLDLALTAFNQIHREIPNSHFLIVGDIHQNVDLTATIKRFGLESAVTILGFVEDLRNFVDYIETADIIINLRHPTVGETSATALRAMAAAKPVIVFDLGWYSELPDSAVIKVPPLDSQGLIAAMRRLAQEPALRQEMGQTAAAHIAQHHQPAAVAQQ